ncbi:MAG TPA: class I SAM-dependent methyltransferase [Thermoanaerobaculia bacterium]
MTEKKGTAISPAEKWDAQYRAGRWDYLASLEQAPRYAVLAAWSHRLCSSPSVLDVGCGEGLLLEVLRRGGDLRYYGIDFAPAAVERARHRIVNSEREIVDCISAEDFDVAVAAPNLVIFNESLNCFAEPVRLLERYLSAVGAGFVLVSIAGFDAALADEIRRIHEERLVAAVSIEDRLVGKTWHLMAIDGSSQAAEGLR